MITFWYKAVKQKNCAANSGYRNYKGYVDWLITLS